MPVSRITRPLALTAALLATGALAVTACSTDPASSDATDHTRGDVETVGHVAPTRDEWVREANAICYLAEAKAAAVYASLDDDADAATVERTYREELLPLIHEQVEGIAALDAPADRQDRVDDFVASAREAIAEAEQLDGTALAAGNDPFTWASIQARKLGLSCGGED